MPEAPVSYVSVWMLGLALGLTACTVSCLPFMGTWALGRAGDMRRLGLDTLMFLLGRFVAYVVLGALAGALGSWLVLQLAGGIGHAVIGLASLLAASSLLWPQARARHHACRAGAAWAASSPFLIGMSLTLIPCLPLTTLLASCAAGRSAWQGGLYGAAFGAGTLITPMLVLIPACGRFGAVLRKQGGWMPSSIRAMAALVLTVLGANRLALVDRGAAWGLPLVCALIVAWAYLHRPATGKPRQVIALQRVD